MSFFKIADLGCGSLTIGPCPDKDNLGNWATDLNALGISHAVSFLEPIEVGRHGLQGERNFLMGQGIGFTHFPIEDFGLPDGAEFAALIYDLENKLASGDNLFLHCAGGIGRAGTTASCLLIQHGEDAETVMEKVAKMRGKTVPETPEQVEFIRNWKLI